MKRIAMLVLALVAGGAVAGPLSAQTERPIQVALFPPIQAFPEEDPIRGLRLSLYGRSMSVTGFDLGLVNHTTASFLGVQFGLVGVAEGEFTGFQNNWAVNVVQGSFEGVQHGVVSSTDFGRGAQISLVNHARNFRGLQLALVNYAETLHGLQIGLLNIIRRGGVLPVMPIVNWSFEDGEPM